jgi:PAS domain S-box-containing protein
VPDTKGAPPARPDPADLATFWELSLDILVLASPDGVLRFVNPSFTRVLGWSRDDVAGRNVFDLLHPDDVEATRDGFAQVAGPGRQISEFRNRYRTRDGQYRTLMWNARTSMDGLHVYAVARDVTDQQRDLELLRLSEERFRQAMTWAAIGMAIVDLDGRFIDVNDALCRIVGRPRDVLTSLTFAEITHPDDVDIDLDLAQQLLEGEIDHYDLEKRYLHADGSVVWILLSGSIVRDDDGTPVHFIAQVQDISDRRRAEQERDHTLRELEQSNEALAQFAAAAAHDLKSPLVVSSSILDVLAERHAQSLPAEAQDLVARGQKQLQRLTARVDGLLRLATFAGRDLCPQPVELGPVIERAWDDAVPERADPPATSLTSDVAETVHVDPDALDVLLHNLFRNASVHGATCVRVTGQQDGDVTTITIDDDGPGIPSDQRDQVFALFARGPGATTPGTGIGLALCRRVVERHGGTITLDDAPTGGLRVQFTLPSG